MNNCKHDQKVWKGQRQFCANCNSILQYKDMNKTVMLPNIKASNQS